MKKIILADEAIDKIKDNDCVGIGGFVGMCHPEGLTRMLGEKYINTGTPRNLTII